MGKKLRRTRGCSPIARPSANPIATASTKATVSSNRVNCSAAGTPRVAKTLSSEAMTCDDGLKNRGSTRKRAATSHKANGTAITMTPVSHGRRATRRLRGPRRRHEQAIDMAKSCDGVDDDREKADRGAERDLGSWAEAEEQHKKRQEQDDGNGIDRGKQRLENLDPIARAADQIAQRDAAGGRNRERSRKLAQCCLKIADEFTRSQDIG